MENFQFYAANLYSLDCEKTAQLYSKLFSFSIVSISKNHAELQTKNGFSIFIDMPSLHCKVSRGTISFSVSNLDFQKMNLEPLQLESYYEKENYASFLDEYYNRVWIFEKRSGSLV
jgi:hypothetical protein